MSNPFANQIGKYMYADGAIGEKSFGGRNFKIVIASAYNVGIIGSEYNGIAILDENNGTVVLDEHEIESTGALGPSARQVAEFERIMAMDWRAFSKFCREHPKFRKNCATDFHARTPQKFIPEVDVVIFPEKSKDEFERRLYPLDSRREIMEFLSNHDVHKVDGPNSDFALAWNVKVGEFDTFPNGETEDFSFDPNFDDAWAYQADTNESLFWNACTAGLRTFTMKSYSTYLGEDAGDYDFDVVGRSGGWLILTQCAELGKLRWEDQKAMKSFLSGLPDGDLLKLYRLVANADHDTRPEAIRREMELQFAHLRHEMEESWKLEEAAQP